MIKKWKFNVFKILFIVKGIFGAKFFIFKKFVIESIISFSRKTDRFYLKTN